ncbi:MAG: cupredoxin domain-containing protein [Actinobacteria bacterium]|nr:cupredoxin domain-containing protein [Actinomycetota bacterium]
MPSKRSFDVTARQFAFEPGILRVNRGDRVELRVRSPDVTHGLYIDGYGVDGKVTPHGELVVRFTADRPGRFALRCSRTCGVFHPFMTGQLVVEPNLLFPGSVGAAAGAAIGAVVYAARTGRREP